MMRSNKVKKDTDERREWHLVIPAPPPPLLPFSPNNMRNREMRRDEQRERKMDERREAR